MEIQMLKTDILPNHVALYNQIIFLTTTSYIHIIDLKGNLIPDIDLNTVKYIKQNLQTVLT